MGARAGKIETPITYHHLIFNAELKAGFDQLLDAMANMDVDHEGEELMNSCEALNGRIQREVTARPALSRIVKSPHNQWTKESLLTACLRLNSEWFHPTIKFLIEANPSALLWKMAAGEYPGPLKDFPLIMIARSRHCVLMPWIATKYPWVLGDGPWQQYPLAFQLIRQYGAVSGNDKCPAATIRQFFEAYPKGLTQVLECTKSLPIHCIALSDEGCDLDLFKWMAEQCPESMMKTDKFGSTPLHYACNNLRQYCGCSPEICKYLIAKCPEAIRMNGKRGKLPIHGLMRYGHQYSQATLEVAMLLLQEYPESFHMAGEYGAPSSSPIIHYCYLQATRKAFQEAVACTKDSLVTSTCDIFGSWARAWCQERKRKRDDGA